MDLKLKIWLRWQCNFFVKWAHLYGMSQDTQMDNPCVKEFEKCPTSLITTEMQTKTTTKWLKSTKMARIDCMLES